MVKVHAEHACDHGTKYTGDGGGHRSTAPEKYRDENRDRFAPRKRCWQETKKWVAGYSKEVQFGVETKARFGQVTKTALGGRRAVQSEEAIVP